MMIEKAVGEAKGSPLRQRMIDQMRIANLAASTQTAYLFEVKRMAAFVTAYGAGLRVHETAKALTPREVGDRRRARHAGKGDR